MIIQWFGQSFFRIETKGKVIAIDPFSKGTGGATRVPRIKADVVLVSHEHPDHNNVGTIEGGPLVFRGPGEYEFQGIFIEGVPSFHDASGGRERGFNTMFAIESEDLRVVHLGDLGEPQLGEAQLEKLGDIDILMIPVGGTYTINGRQAFQIVSRIEPKVVIPMHYKVGLSNSPLDTADKFLKEFGMKLNPEEKISVRKKEILEEKIKPILLRALAFT